MRRRTALLGAIGAGARRLACAGDRLDVVRIVHGFPVGGIADVTARGLAEALHGGYAQASIVDSRTGAGGRIAADQVKASRPDGRTLLLTPMSCMAIYPHVFRSLAYDPFKDFAPIAIAATFGLGMAVGPSVPVQVGSVQQLLTWMRENPRQAVFGSASAGTSAHFLGAALSQQSAVPMQHVPYRGSMPGITDLEGGQIPLMITGLGDLLAHADRIKLRVIATSEALRSRFAPNVPTLAESGFPGLKFVEWLGLFAPAATPGRLINAAAEATRSSAATAETRDALAALSMEPRSSSPADLAAHLRADYERWAPIIKATGFAINS